MRWSTRKGPECRSGAPTTCAHLVSNHISCLHLVLGIHRLATTDCDGGVSILLRLHLPASLTTSRYFQRDATPPLPAPLNLA